MFFNGQFVDEDKYYDNLLKDYEKRENDESEDAESDTL